MQVYLVGGAVRDLLLHQPVQDRDFVVVGASPQEMQARGFVPIGQDFPVFLHPRTHEQYALARTERKVGCGYHGFTFFTDPHISLEQDLARRDLTINAMAIACPNSPLEQGFVDWLKPSPSAELKASIGPIIDPHGGQKDLQAACLRHVSPAFSEDPVRILRVARFAARLPHFHIHPQTLGLMRHMVQQGETRALVAERVWQEMARALMEQTPSRFFEVLEQSQALAHCWPMAISDTTRTQLDHAASQQAPLNVRVAILAQSTPCLRDFQRQAQTQRIPREAIQLSSLWLREQPMLSHAHTLTGLDWLALFERCDAWRQQNRFQQWCQVWALTAPTQWGTIRPALEKAWQAAQQIDAGKIARTIASAQGPAIAQAIHHARLTAIQDALSSFA